MPKKGDRREKPIAGNPADPNGMHVLVRRFFEVLTVRNYSPETIQKHRLQLNDFIRWCEDRELCKPRDITRHDLQAYQRHLSRSTDKRGNTYSHRNQYGRICSIRCWYQWLVKQELVPHNPAADLDLPRLGSRLPRHVLSESEAETILSEPAVTEPLGVRDRAILETFYSTGMRRMELVHLQVHDLDSERACRNHSPGEKQERTGSCRSALERFSGSKSTWLKCGRSLEVDPHQSKHCFSPPIGNEFSGSTMSKLVGEYVAAAAIGKTGSCHLFRHTMATLDARRRGRRPLHPGDAGASEPGNDAGLHAGLDSQTPAGACRFASGQKYSLGHR